ncbi:MAG: IS200/IS605 family transposase [Planctomycetales bacterium]|jgi:putative transposase
MSSHVYHEIFLHLNWHTKLSMRLLNPKLEKQVYSHIATRIKQTKGVWLHGIGGTPTHIHLAISLEPSVTISELVQQLKGGSSHDINSQVNDKIPHWQRGYGIVSFGKNNLPWILNYIAKQKEHHASGRIYDRLEWNGVEEPGRDDG